MDTSAHVSLLYAISVSCLVNVTSVTSNNQARLDRHRTFHATCVEDTPLCTTRYTLIHSFIIHHITLLSLSLSESLSLVFVMSDFDLSTVLSSFQKEEGRCDKPLSRGQCISYVFNFLARNPTVSQASLGAAIGVQRQVIGRWLKGASGQHRPSDEKFNEVWHKIVPILNAEAEEDLSSESRRLLQEAVQRKKRKVREEKEEEEKEVEEREEVGEVTGNTVQILTSLKPLMVGKTAILRWTENGISMELELKDA
jgi:hypothetical protein